MAKNNTTKKQADEECKKECSSCPTATTCASAKSGQAGLPPKADIDVKHVIMVLSGKGGVGKSTVSVNLAYALSAHGKKVGLLDLDMHGPNVPKMLGIEDHKLAMMDDRIEPVHVTGNLSVISMAFLLPDTSTPIIWRGPMKMAAIQQFLTEVNWGSLDYLVVDLPPGTGDEALTIAQLAPNVRGAVVVTTPQDVATMDARKSAKFIEKLGLPVIGIIENMSGMLCPTAASRSNSLAEAAARRFPTNSRSRSSGQFRWISRCAKPEMKAGRSSSGVATALRGRAWTPLCRNS